MARQVLELRRQVLGEEHPHTLDSMSNLAGALHELGRHDEAEALYIEVLAIHRRVLGEKHRPTLDAVNDLAVLYSDLGRFKEAETLTSEAIAVARDSLPAGDRRIGEYRGTHGRILTQLELYEDAERALLEAHTILHAVQGATDSLTLETARSLAILYEAWDKPAEAAKWRAESSTDSTPERRN